MKETQLTIPEVQAIEAYNKHYKKPTHTKQLSKFLHELNRDMTVRQLLKVVSA